MEFKELDPILHSQLRLAVMSILISVKEADFIFIKEKNIFSDFWKTTALTSVISICAAVTRSLELTGFPRRRRANPSRSGSELSRPLRIKSTNSTLLILGR